MVTFFRRHVNAKLAAIWLVTAIPLAILLAVTYAQWYSARLSLIEQERRGYAQSVAESFELLLADVRFDLRLTGSEVADAGPSSPESTATMDRLKSSHPAANVVFTDIKGRVLGASDPKLIGSRLTGDRALKAALRDPKGSAVEPSSERSAGGVVGFHVAQVIPARDEKPGGVMMMLIDVKKLHNSFPVNVPSGGISVIDSAGQVIFQNENIRFAAKMDRWGQRFPFIREALQGNVSTTRAFKFPLGGTRIGVFVPIKPLGWAAGSSIAPRVALAPFYRGLSYGLPIALFVIAIALLLSAGIARNIRRSLGELVYDARRIGSGDLDAPVRVTREDEIGQVAQSLEAARGEIEETRGLAAEELETTMQLLAAARSLGNWTELSSVLDQLAESVRVATRHRRVFVHLWDEDRRCLVLTAAAGEGAAAMGSCYEWDLLAAPTKQALSETRTVIVDYDKIQSIGEKPYAGTMDFRVALLVPLVDQSGLVGLLVVDDPGERHEFFQREIAVVEGIAAQAVSAIRNARFLGAEIERTRLSQSMVKINEDLASSLDIEVTLPLVLKRAIDELGGKGGSVVDRAEGGWQIRHVVGPETPKLQAGTFFLEDEAPAMSKLSQTQEPYLIHDVASATDVNREVAEQAGYQAYASYPLVVRGEVTGGLTIFFAEPRKLTEQELDYLQRVAFSVSLAEENSRLFKVEHRIAETLQGALLATPERINGVEFARSYHSATEAARVGGDFYDLFEISPGLVGITIGDISGHGIDAAVQTSLAKNAVRVLAGEGKKPHEVMASANRILHNSLPPNIFATVFFAVLNLQDGMLEYCSAGHPAGLHVRSGNRIEQLIVSSPLVGAFRNVEFNLAIKRLELGDLLFLYTDGLVEARRNGDKTFYGEKRVIDALSAMVEETPAGIIERIVDDVLGFTEGRLTDDLAVLVVKYMGSGG